MSSKGKFRLQKILHLRHHQEQQIRLELAKAASQCAFLEQEIKDLTNQHCNNFQQRHTSEMNVTLMMSYELFARRLTKEISQKRQALLHKKEQHHSLTQAFLEAQKKRKILENLQEKQKEFSRQEENRRQALAVDELTQAAYILAKKGLIRDH